MQAGSDVLSSSHQFTRQFSQREYRDALGLFATGVVVVTSKDADNKHIGATISSFSSVSLDPPLILFSIARSSNAFAAWQSTDAFAVNILAERQSGLSATFARALADKWQGVETSTGSNGSPLLAGSLASLECQSYARYDGGDHLIMVGLVTSITVNRDRAATPLVFFGGKYRQLDPSSGILTPPATDHWLHGW